MMMFTTMHLLGQILKPDPSVPVLDGDASPAWPFIIAGLMVVGIMLIGFKQARRNHLDKAD